MVQTAPSRPAPNVKPGAMIADKYRIEKELGRGGFGVVVRARHLALDGLVAIKVLTDSDAGAEAFAEDAERFRREAQATAMLRGEHVVRILDVDVLESGFPYIVMEYLEGDTLHTVLYTKQLSIADAVDITIQVLSALGEAHAAGIVHRDLKPANVFITKPTLGVSQVKVLDFGVSKTFDPDAKSLTRTGAVIGTAAYMAPEQMMDAKRVDGRADLWSAAVILYELLSRRNPFGDPNDPSTLSAVLTKQATPLSFHRPNIPPVLDAVLMRCFARDPMQRYQTAAEMAFALAELASPRAALALDALRRTGPATGAAMPGGGRRPSLAPSGPALGPGPSAPAKRSATRLALPLFGLALGLGLGVIGAILVLRPRPKVAPGPSVSASASASGSPSAKPRAR